VEKVPVSVSPEGNPVKMTEVVVAASVVEAAGVVEAGLY
jgi:hypothetical protein